MINNVSLLFSLVAVVFVVVRAVMLDKTLPWFKPAPAKKPVVRIGADIARRT